MEEWMVVVESIKVYLIRDDVLANQNGLLALI